MPPEKRLRRECREDAAAPVARPYRQGFRLPGLAAALLAFPAGWAAAADAAGPDLAAGRAIFHGQGGGTAVVAGGVSVPAGRFGCASCHGRDALGGAEGGFVAPPVGWAWLSRRTEKRPAYDARALARLLEAGVAPDGHVIGGPMPRYRFTPAELDGLAGYLRVVEDEDRPGVSEDAVRVTVFFDPRYPEAGERVRRSAAAALERMGDPAVWGRRLRIAAAPAGDGVFPASGLAALLPVTGGEGFVRAAAAAGLPSLAPVGGLVGDEDPGLVRGVGASLRAQWGRLDGEAPPEAVVVYPDSLGEGEAAALAARLKIGPARSRLPASRWQGRSPALVLGGLDSLPGPQATRGVTLYAPLDGSARSAERWRACGATLVLADGRPPEDGARRGAELDRLADAALRALVEALAEAGRDVTRTRLAAAFDRVRFDIPGWPPIDYGADRLTGTDRVELLTLPPLRPAQGG